MNRWPASAHSRDPTTRGGEWGVSLLQEKAKVVGAEIGERLNIFFPIFYGMQLSLWMFLRLVQLVYP